jgi:hypothetical protein
VLLVDAALRDADGEQYNFTLLYSRLIQLMWTPVARRRNTGRMHRRKALGALQLSILAIVLIACHRLPPPRLVYSSGFTFADYDYVVVSKPTAGTSGSARLYGMDIDFANLMGRYNMKVIGDKELASMEPTFRRRALFARMALEANGRVNLITVSFDDVITNRTGASASAAVNGDIFTTSERTRVFEALSNVLVKALQHDKGTIVMDVQ